MFHLKIFEAAHVEEEHVEVTLCHQSNTYRVIHDKIIVHDNVDM